MLHDKIVAAIRTGCAVFGATALTALITWLTGHGVDVELDAETQLLILGVVAGVLVALYNFAVGWLTEHVWDGFGWLLGVNKPPVYAEPLLEEEDSELPLDPSRPVDADTPLPFEH